MYPRNAASPERISIGPVVLIADGTVQTSGVTVRIIPFGGSEADGAGTTAYSTDGVVLYTPTQAETNYTSFVLIAKKTACIPANVTVVTSASSTAGYAGTDQSKIANAASTVNLSGTTIKTATDIETDTQDIQARLPAALVDGRIIAVAQIVSDKTGYTATVSDKTGFKLASDGLALVTAWTVGITGNLTGNVTGSVGSISGVTFPANFSSMVINAGNGHVAAALHNAQPNSIPEDAFVTGALSARVLAADAATEIATAVGTLQVLTRLDSMIESDGAGQFRFDTIALEMGAGGAGGTDWTANERTAIRAILGVPTSGTTPSDPTTGILDEIRDKTALITSGSVQTSIPVTAQGQITGPLYIGDDYLTANGRQFDWTIALPTGFVAATSTCKFGMIFEDESGVSEFNLSGTVADVGSGNVRLRFELPRATTGALKAGFHRWSTEIVSATGVEVTAVAYSDRKLVEWREKQT